MDLWNVRNLDPPAINSCKSAMKEIDIKFLNGVLLQSVYFFENQQHLYTEAALLSRTIYRMKMKFRSSKDLKAIEKINRALRVYLNLQISKVLKRISDSVPSNYKRNQTYILTKNMLDYVLVRLQGLGKLLLRILETCKVAATLAHQRLKVGHFWNLAIIIYGMISRIFVISKELLKYTCNLYTDLVPFSTKLTNTGPQWLPEEYSLPKQLNEWLNLDWMDFEKTVIEIPDEYESGSHLSYFNLIEDSDDDIELCDEYVLIKDDSVCDLNSTKGDESVQLIDDNENQVFNGFQQDIDIGEEVINVDETVKGQERQINEAFRKKRKRKKKPLNKASSSTQNQNSCDSVIFIDESPAKKKKTIGPITNPTSIQKRPKRKKRKKKF